MNKQEETQVCLNCKLSVCCGEDSCLVIKAGNIRKSVKITLLRDLLLAGYDPAAIIFSVVEGTPLE